MPDNIAATLLDWYDANARDLPWRAAPGATLANPYWVWLSEVMLQQTQVATVKPYFAKFLARWPDFASLAAADDADVMAAWAGLGYYARARNMLACARAIAAGGMPETEEGLRALPGVGAYTAAAIAAIAFGRRAVVVDGNVERVVARLFALAEPLPGAKPRIWALTDSITPDARAGDFAQAMMDLGSGICTARRPRCLLCPLRPSCAGFASGAPEMFPVKAAKSAKPKRYGTLFWAECDGEVLLVQRPAKGLFGGMRALPTSEWGSTRTGLESPPFQAGWRLLDSKVNHSLTHFDLELDLAVAQVERHVSGLWWPVAEIGSAGLPSVFAKAARIFMGETG
ncbi:MAG: A/G-specific adenine glycosylase [Pseudomonadota bacterium]